MKQTIHILFVIIILAFSGCKKDDVKVQNFNVVSESVDKRATSIAITLNYIYPSVIQTFDCYISVCANMDDAINVHGEINGKTIKINIYDLQANTTYYYYYEHSNGIDDLTKSEIKKITTNDYSLPSVITNGVINLTTTSAICGGDVIDDGDLEVIEKGLCWSANSVPTIYDNHTTIGMGLGSFTTVLTELIPYTTYYVRAYASNSLGTSYGELKSFIATYSGSIGGLFSVSSSKRICFSKGNLQYQASTNTWRFAENQYDCIGDDNSKISPNYNGWIDLFGWGTSGINHGAVCYQPYSTSTNDNDYLAYGSRLYGLNDQTGQADWGYNAISNGGNTITKWHTLSRDEWDYVLFNRNTKSDKRFVKARVCGINGVILLPDNWEDGYYNLNDVNQATANFSSNIISSSMWNDSLECHGAVFLPAAGLRNGTSAKNVNTWGIYWLSSINVLQYNLGAYYVNFIEDNLDIDSYIHRDRGCSVRLVYYAE